MIYLKSSDEIALMRRAGRLAADALAFVLDAVKPGVTTAYLDAVAEEFIRNRGGKPAFKGYHGYPASICTSRNETVVHGIPSAADVVEEGDIVSIDLGVERDGFFGDIAWSILVGEGSEGARRLLSVARESLFRGIEEAVPGNHLFDIGAAIQEFVEAKGYNVVRQFVGHGIGRAMHEDPQVPNFGRRGTGVLLKEGMTLAIEPMVNEGGHEVVVLGDGWTVKTADGSLSAHFEHTVAITADGPEILTWNERFL